MRKYIILIAFVLLCGTTTPGHSRAAGDNITLNLPEIVLAEAVEAVLPLSYPADSKNIRGNITVRRISELQLLEQTVKCRLELAGDALQILTEVAGHQINLNVGSLELDFITKAKLRFDPARQTLFITPVIDEVVSSRDGGGGDIGQALLALINGREFPLNLDDIDPVVARAGAKTLTITTRIADIQARKERLQFLLKPQISASTEQ